MLDGAGANLKLGLYEKDPLTNMLGGLGMNKLNSRKMLDGTGIEKAS